ncbi:MAG: hypothetical protein M0P40_06100 [Bacteroidales bacterium]|nr:hypothetical protein [Bacteroidales bacterium]MDD2264887.1 hypothetical protein [Bacteroidales bacterium]MDD2831963.1 hypothetical protein [Bacteroidales bacterium]MDD4473574.1 hypothetical protein [Bacteroidales bacterium]MDD5047109.1 hypothetical protein [Bacteroidales bacterium]
MNRTVMIAHASRIMRAEIKRKTDDMFIPVTAATPPKNKGDINCPNHAQAMPTDIAFTDKD